MHYHWLGISGPIVSDPTRYLRKSRTDLPFYGEFEPMIIKTHIEFSRLANAISRDSILRDDNRSHFDALSLWRVLGCIGMRKGSVGADCFPVRKKCLVLRPWANPGSEIRTLGSITRMRIEA